MARLIGNDDLFVVQLQDSIHPSAQQDEIVSVKFETIVDSAVDIAVPGNRIPNTGPRLDYLGNVLPADPTLGPYGDGKAGLMYPGAGLYFDETTGQLDVAVNSDLQFIGVIEYDDDPDSSGATEWELGLDNDSLPSVRKGNFYVVGESELVLKPEIWNLSDNTDAEPKLGDLVVCIDDSVPGSAPDERDSHVWNVIPNVTGGQAVLQIRTVGADYDMMSDRGQNKNNYAEVHTEFPSASNQRPLIRIRKAGFVPGDPNDTVDNGHYVGGLITEFDKEKIDRLDLNIFEAGWVKSLTLKEDKTTSDSLSILTLFNRLKPQYTSLTLSSTPAEEDKFGVVELASQVIIDQAINATSDSIGTTGRTDEVVMTPHKTMQNFVPRLFNVLPALELSNNSNLPTP